MAEIPKSRKIDLGQIVKLRQMTFLNSLEKTIEIRNSRAETAYQSV